MKEDLKSKRYLTRKEAAELLGVTPQTVSNYIYRGVLVEKEKNDASNAIKIVTASVVKLLEDGYDIIEQTRVIDEYKKELFEQIHDIREEKEALSATLEAIKAKNQYLKHLKKVTETLSAYLVKEEGLTRREQSIMSDLILNKNEEYIVKRYGLKKERIRQIFIRSLRIIMSNADREYETIRKENRQLVVQNKLLKETIERLEQQLNSENSQGETAEKNRMSSDSNIVRIPASFIGLKGISNRLYNILRVMNISHIYEIALLSRYKFARTRNLGRKSLNETEELLEKHGLKFSLESLLKVCSNSTEEEYIEVPISVLLEKQKSL